jgi:hypothetical protein
MTLARAGAAHRQLPIFLFPAKDNSTGGGPLISLAISLRWRGQISSSSAKLLKKNIDIVQLERKREVRIRDASELLNPCGRFQNCTLLALF